MTAPRRLLSVALALAAVAAGKPLAPPRYGALADADRGALLARAATATSLPERLEAFSAPFLGTRYANSPLGEGEGTDPDPRLRWDAVDCLTFVETAIALAAADQPGDVLAVLDDLRYVAGPPTFLNRNHFVEAQWVPNNVLKGYLRDLSREVAGDRATVAEKLYSPEAWTARKKLGDMPLRRDEIPRGRFALPMVPLAVAIERLQSIPAGTLLFVIRRDSFSQPTRVTHVGLVLVRAGRRFLRHASKTPFDRVVDEPLDHFFARNSRYAKWPVEGVALYEVARPLSRVRQLAASAGATPDP